MKSFKEKFGKRVQAIRKSKNLTQEKLAEVIGLDTPNLSNIERGKRFVTSDTLEKIVKALGVSEKELFDFDYMQDRDELIKSINELLDKANSRELEYFYRMICLYKEQL